jgi:hypothetical protein
MDHKIAVEKLGGKESRKIANNTYLKALEGGAIALRLHETNILTFTPDKKTVYNSGGWRTVTTKARMNEYGPLSIRQEKGVWYIGDKVYQDGCYVKSGKVYGALPVKAADKSKKDVKAIREYCREFMDEFFAYEIPAPSGGDCWGCYMKTENGERPLGRGGDHVRQHVREKYFVPSLLVAACESFPISMIAKNMFALAWNPANVKDRENSGFIVDIARRQMESSLVRYCKRAFKIAA